MALEIECMHMCIKACRLLTALVIFLYCRCVLYVQLGIVVAVDSLLYYDDDDDDDGEDNNECLPNAAECFNFGFLMKLASIYCLHWTKVLGFVDELDYLFIFPHWILDRRTLFGRSRVWFDWTLKYSYIDLRVCTFENLDALQPMRIFIFSSWNYVWLSLLRDYDEFKIKYEQFYGCVRTFDI